MHQPSIPAHGLAEFLAPMPEFRGNEKSCFERPVKPFRRIEIRNAGFQLGQHSITLSAQFEGPFLGLRIRFSDRNVALELTSSIIMEGCKGDLTTFVYNGRVSQKRAFRITRLRV